MKTIQNQKPTSYDIVKETALLNSSLPREEIERICKESFSKNAISKRLQLLIQKYGLDTKKILDVGCACGRHLVYFGEGSVGLELKPNEVEFARAIGLKVIQCNIEDKWEFTEAGFDAVWCFSILDHVISPHKLLMECWRKLKDDGLIFICVSAIPHPLVQRLFKLRLGYVPYQATEHLYAYTRRSLEFLLERAGYRVVEVVISPPVQLRFLTPLIKLLSRYGGSVQLTVVAEKNPEFKYAEKRLKAFTPSWMLELDKR